MFFFFNDTAPTEIYTLSLHDALPITRQLDAGADAELGVDVAQVGLDGLRAEHELLGDLAVRAAGGDQLGDLALAVREDAIAVARRRAADPVSEPSQLAHRLVAPARRAEPRQGLLGRDERPQRRGAV